MERVLQPPFDMLVPWIAVVLVLIAALVGLGVHLKRRVDAHRRR